MQLIKLLQVFGKLIRFSHGAVRNVLFLVHTLMHGVGKGSIANVFEFQQVLQGHGIQSELLKNFLLLHSFDPHQAPVASGQLTKLAPHAKGQRLAARLYMLEERDVRGHPIGQSFFMRALHVFFQSPLPRLETQHAPRDIVVSMHFPIVQSRQTFHVHFCDSSAVCKIQNVRIRNLRLISHSNSVRGRTTHLKESQLDPFVPGQIQMTRKHNDRFSKRPRNMHTKVGFKNDGIRIVSCS
ncbi:uncharacterized protein TNCV_1728831 [Trichonephila clavipes]|nr:uncharacterized protein TNCV_1728831 [Trichonephila clavipes]